MCTYIRQRPIKMASKARSTSDIYRCSCALL